MNEEKAKNNPAHKRRNHRHHNRGKKPADRASVPNQKNIKEAVPPPELPPLEAVISPFERNEDKHSFRIGDPIDLATLDSVEIPEDYPFADDALLFPNKKREEALKDDSIEKTEIVGIRFKSTGKTYYFAQLRDRGDGSRSRIR